MKMTTVWTDFEAGLNAFSGDWPEITDHSDLFSLQGDTFNIEAVCPGYNPESQCWATWQRDERGRVIVSGYDPELDLDNHWLCHCGNYITHGGRCGCGNEPPWGADDGEDWEGEDLDGGFFSEFEGDDGGDFIEFVETFEDEPVDLLDVDDYFDFEHA